MFPRLIKDFIAVKQTEMSGEEQYNRRRKRSDLWDHFEQKAECKYCKALLCADPVRDGTSRLKKHYEVTCPVRHPNKARRGRGREHYGSPAASDQQEVNHNLQNASVISGSDSDNSGRQTTVAAQDQLLSMIALHGFPSSLVEDLQFKRFLQMICPDFKMPLVDDIQKKCDALFDQEMSSLKDAIGRTPGLVSLSLGEAKTPLGKMAYLAAHFIDDEWKLHRRVLQVFKSLAEGDTAYGKILDIKDYYIEYVGDPHNYQELKGVMSRWGLLPKFSAILIEHVGTVRDFGQFLLNDNYLPHLSATQHKLFCSTNIWGDLHDVWSEYSIIYPLKDTYGEDCIHAFQNETLKKKRREISSRLQLDCPWMYDTKWYAYYYALEIIHDECSSAPQKIAALAGNVLFHETPITELLRSALETTCNAIRTISSSSSPTSNLWLIEMLNLRKLLASVNDYDSGRNEDTDHELSSSSKDEYDLGALRIALGHVYRMLESSYLLLSVPLALDPRYKLVYVESFLQNTSLGADAIFKVGEVFRQLFTEYKNQVTEIENSNQTTGMERANHVNEMDVDTSRQENGNTWQKLIDQSGSQESSTELNAYLQDEMVPLDQKDFDILKWWKDNCDRYPTVARMARDFLAIPACTIPSPQLMIEITNHLRRYA